MKTSTNAWVPWSKPFIFLLCLAPFALLVWRAINNDLGADPTNEITHQTGTWALRFLLTSLAMTPLRKLLGSSWPIRFRRMLGLFAFFYATMHLATYVFVDLGLYWPQVLEDIVKRPYITVGFGAWLILLALATTSTRGMQRRLGRQWARLHKLVYLAIGLVILHFLWLVKADLREPIIYAAIAAVLLAFRIKPLKTLRN